MKKQSEIIFDVENVKKATLKYLEKEPSAEDLKWLLGELARIEQLVSDNWPLSNDDKRTIEIGVYGARNLHELDNAKLAVMLAQLDAKLKK